jgi:hypothetical protein
MDIAIPFLAVTNYTFSISEALSVFLFFYCFGFVIALVIDYFKKKLDKEIAPYQEQYEFIKLLTAS